MNQSEYEALYRQARKTYPNLTRETMTEIRRTYKSASAAIAKKIKSAELAGKAQLTINSNLAIQNQLDEAVEAIDIKLAQQIDKTTRAGINKTSDINVKYLSESFAAVGSSKVSAAGISEMYVSINETVIETMINRIYQDGYKLSDRVWKVGQDYRNKINSIMTQGFSMGRSSIQIAGDVQKYTVSGKFGLAKSYGPNLIKGDVDAFRKGKAQRIDWKAFETKYGKEITTSSKAFMRRIGTRIDYRALRLVRSELYASLQEAAGIQGKANCGSSGLYDWVLEGNRQHWKCSCPDYAKNSPYKYENIPGYPHSNCFTPDTKILTASGYKEIQNILPGESVISHDGSIQKIRAIWKNYFDGELINLKTNENEILCTENHPLWSESGWSMAHVFEPGFNISCININVESFPFIKSISNNFPSKRNKKRSFFRIMHLLYRGTVPITAINFNGKFYIREGEINIEFVDGKIWDWVFTDLDQGIEKHLFVNRSDLTGIKFRSFKKFFMRSFNSPDGIVCGSSVGNSAIGITPNSTFMISRRFKSKADKIFFNRTPVYSHDFRNLIYREIIIPEKFDKKRIIDYNFSTHNRPIVDVIKKKYKGIIYNLSVENTNTYIANGFIVHNCRCDIRPQLRDNKTFNADLKTWVNGGKVDYVDDWYYSTYLK